MITIFLALTLTGQSQVATCVDAMRADWPRLVEAEQTFTERLFPRTEFDDPPAAPVARAIPPEQKATLEAVSRLEALCAGDAEARARLRSLEVALRIRIEDYAGALAAFERVPLDPASADISFAAPALLNAAAGVQDRVRFMAARTAVRAAHDAAMARQGWPRAMRFETLLAEVDGYRASGAWPAWVLVAWPREGGMPATLTLYPERGGGRDVALDARFRTCSWSVGVDTSHMGAKPDAAQAERIARRTFASASDLVGDTERPGHVPDAQKAMARLQEVPAPGCTSLPEILPGFGQPVCFTGLEYATDGSRPTPAQLASMLDGSVAQRGEAADYIFAHPEAVEPFTLLQPIMFEMQRGNNLRASFWFYFWQIRSLPWAALGPRDQYAALRASINAMMGASINEWIGRDPDAMREVATRAMAYERRMPLFTGRPDGVSETAWAKAVEAGRADYAEGFAKAVGDPAAFRRKMVEGRAKNGLDAGPLDQPGKPLAEAWR